MMHLKNENASQLSADWHLFKIVFLFHYFELTYFAASPQAGMTARIKGFSIFIEQAKT